MSVNLCCVLLFRAGWPSARVQDEALAWRTLAAVKITWLLSLTVARQKKRCKCRGVLALLNIIRARASCSPGTATGGLQVYKGTHDIEWRYSVSCCFYVVPRRQSVTGEAACNR